MKTWLPTEGVLPRTQRLDRVPPVQAARLLNAEDFNAARAVKQAAPALAQAIACAADTFLNKHKIIFIGAGTSGRLGILEAVECVPTFGVRPGQITGILAGGPKAMFRSVENAEDNAAQGGKDVLKKARAGDFVLALTASGTTPYALGALQAARQAGCRTALLACNPKADTRNADIFICLDTGAEALSGSTRMKAGSATKMALNAITTGAMARAGKIYGNLMVDVKPSNEKLVRRCVTIVCSAAECSEAEATEALEKCGYRPKVAIVMILRGVDAEVARKLLDNAQGRIARVLEG